MELSSAKYHASSKVCFQHPPFPFLPQSQRIGEQCVELEMSSTAPQLEGETHSEKSFENFDSFCLLFSNVKLVNGRCELRGIWFQETRQRKPASKEKRLDEKVRIPRRTAASGFFLASLPSCGTLLCFFSRLSERRRKNSTPPQLNLSTCGSDAPSQ